ncbi:MAG: glycosyltransferase family 4 protein [Bacillota bacterium]|nr:glycosyltransferase family 4 protein [Bacillota bacterium]
MGKDIWICNHHATNTMLLKSGRHHWLAKELRKNGYNPTIFTASSKHYNEGIDLGNKLYMENESDGNRYVVVKTNNYNGNGFQRVKSMLVFATNLVRTGKKYAKINGTPDVIIGSSVHPFTCVAAIKLARRFKCKCICEIRDLWPESIIAYKVSSPNSLGVKALYKLEKWIYTNADRLIFTMEGGKDYIIKQGWDKEDGGPVDLKKVFYVNNGVDLESYVEYKKTNTFEDEDLDDKEAYKIIYTGSLGDSDKSIWNLIEAADLMNNDPDFEKCRILIYGKGDQEQKMKDLCKERELNNISFKGLVNRKFIPYVLSKCDLNILNCDDCSIIEKYGGSQNKLSEYIASGHPIITGESGKYCIVANYKIGMSVEDITPKRLCEAIKELKDMSSEQKEEMKKALDYATNEFSWKTLAGKVIDIIEN